MRLSRREFLYYSTLTAVGMLSGCATNPVTGRSQLMMVSENQEVAIDKKNAPYQLSADYGTSQDADLNRYISQVGGNLARITHRPELPYAFHCVNACYINAYAFPGGTIAITRGILLAMENEAELAALLGHELGHVNARHTAQQMTKGTLFQALVGGASIAAGSGSLSSQMLTQLGGLGGTVLLATYSRSNERQADTLAMEYMAKAGYNPIGAVNLMEMLTEKSKHQPSMLEIMFSTHPMSQERLMSAQDQLRHFAYQDMPVYKERYMDNTATLRQKSVLITSIQQGEEALAKKEYSAAEALLQKALEQDANDYAALVIMAKCHLLQKNESQAAHYAARAKEVYPQEAQAYLLGSLANIRSNNFDQALNDLNTYDQLLPDNPTISFYKGLSLEGMQSTREAARHYYEYLKVVNQGDLAKHAHNRLQEWGYIQ